MREQGAGHVFQFSSVGGRVGPVGRAPYAAAKWGVEGFSEVLSKEVGPLGVKVTIIEPGGFRTDFAGSSTAIREGRPEYDATVGKTARFQRDYNGQNDLTKMESDRRWKDLSISTDIKLESGSNCLAPDKADAEALRFKYSATEAEAKD
jgi:NAD(P)-dependent dehydrogenase (short-subunit alcohol dehydrogenase family)